jgi:hypothetical protein
VHPGADGDSDNGVMGVGIALLSEGLEVAVALLVDVIDDPSFPRLPAGAFPGAFADRHCQPPPLKITNVSQ